MYLELHMIQNFAPANLNRDDTNNPKDCEFGGVRRARISSQCIKRAIRTAPAFAESAQLEIGQRTKRVIERLAGQIGAARPAAEVNAVLTAFVPAFLSKLDGKSDKNNPRTAVLLYLSAGEMTDISNKLLENWAELADDEKKRAAAAERLSKELVREFKGRTSAPDIALFGRMLAEKPELNIDAACQVAHVLSTHRVTMEMDFYTAVDDLNPDDTAGAGMMGFTGYNSACFYRYARLDWEQLVRNLGGDRELALKAAQGFLCASVEAVPTGKQNGFAAQNPPSFILAVVRNGGAAWSLANAFEKPVRATGEGGLVAPSVKALESYWGQLTTVYGSRSIAGTAALALGGDLGLSELKSALKDNLDAWLAAALQPIKEQLA